ncbi:hypothetical protein GGR56DRAFT_134915 [Xylariaceae sp. FL0804]|nr:hypothetical protein GGR56DRAFT_134915 [Xylariaceae sp. FL0804]
MAESPGQGLFVDPQRPGHKRPSGRRRAMDFVVSPHFSTYSLHESTSSTSPGCLSTGQPWLSRAVHCSVLDRRPGWHREPSVSSVLLIMVCKPSPSYQRAPPRRDACDLHIVPWTVAALTAVRTAPPDSRYYTPYYVRVYESRLADFAGDADQLLLSTLAQWHSSATRLALLNSQSCEGYLVRASVICIYRTHSYPIFRCHCSSRCALFHPLRSTSTLCYSNAWYGVPYPPMGRGPNVEKKGRNTL